MSPTTGVLLAALAGCTSRGYLLHGRWRELAPEQRLQVPARCAPNAALPASAMDSAARAYACARGQPLRYEWVPEQPCERRPWSSVLLPNRTVWIIGDSTSMQSAFVLHCSVSSVLAPGRANEQWHKPPWSGHFPAQGRDARNNRTTMCATLGESRLCYLPAGSDDGLTVARALALAIAHGNARASDIALMNSGSWQMGKGRRGDAYQRSAVADVAKLGAHPSCPRLIWRETFAQHFPTADGVYTRRLNRSSARCTGRPAVQPPILDEVATSLRKHMPVLPAWRLTQNLSEAHVGAASSGGQLDCTHYCNLGGVIDATLDALAWADYGEEPAHSRSPARR